MLPLTLHNGMTDNTYLIMQRVIEKTALHASGGKASADLQYWLAQPVQARLAVVEELRRQMWGQDAERRLQRACRITSLHGLNPD